MPTKIKIASIEVEYEGPNPARALAAIVNPEYAECPACGLCCGVDDAGRYRSHEAIDEPRGVECEMSGEWFDGEGS